MFTIEKICLLFNDPKFTQVKKWNPEEQEETLHKIYAGQKQVRRNKVIAKTISRGEIKENSSFSNKNSASNVLLTNYSMTDFLQSRLQSYENRIVNTIENTYAEKERIKEKYNVAASVFEQSNLKIENTITKTKPTFEISIDQIEKEVEEIRQLYEENTFLKNMNSDIKKRIEQRQIALNKK